MGLREDILTAFPQLTHKTRDDKLIAETLSEGRWKPANVTGGIGKFIEILGDGAVGTLSEMAGKGPDAPEFWLLRIMGDVRADISAPGVVSLFAASTVFSEGQKAALTVALVTPDPITERDVAKALEGVFDAAIKADQEALEAAERAAREAAALAEGAEIKP